MKIGIGTVQFGLPYGVSNNHGQTNIDEVKDILKIAHENKIQILDTATLYGNSEEVLGQSLEQNHTFKIVTKTPYFNTDQITDAEINKLVTSISRSLEKLKQPQLYGVLFHNANDVFCKGGKRLFIALEKLKTQNLISKIGFSAYYPEQIDQLLNYFKFDLIQIPINIIDQKLLLDGHLEKLKQRNIEIHARSVFLQGLLLMGQKEIPAYFNPISKLLKSFHNTIADLKITPIQAALSFAKNINFLDCILIGINNKKQLLENINAYNTTNINIDFSQFACFDENFTNPSKWKIQK